jgi:hypothetical protein
MKKVFSLLIIAASFLSACYYDNFKELNPFIEEAVCDTVSTTTISFASQVVPILQNQCSTGSAGCHSSNSGRDLSAHSAVINTYTAAKLLSSIKWDGNASQMPKSSGAKIDDCSIKTIELWINQGKLNN